MWRIKDRRRKLQWLLQDRDSHDTCPIFIFGAHRNGAGMLGECLGSRPARKNLGDTDTRAFENHTLCDLQTIDRLIASCRYPFLVFKPVMNSHRVQKVLALRSTA
jgi:hypothetical protein